MKKSVFDRLFEQTIVQENGCWEFTGHLSQYGYGKIYAFGKHMRTHRLSYELCVDDIPKGIMVLHKCDNRCCINPNHLFLGTGLDNIRDCINKGRRGSGRALLTVDEVYKIKNMLKDGCTLSKISKQFDVAKSTIGMISTGKNWSHIK